MGNAPTTSSDRARWLPDGTRVVVRGRVVIIHTPPTKSGKRTMFLTIEDDAGLLDVTVFEDVGRRDAKVILAEPELVVEGIVNRFGLRGVSILAKRVAAAPREETGGRSRTGVQPGLFDGISADGKPRRIAGDEKDE
ncbi:MAG: OB-fold nucleic acid binding domain-containing protein [Desulfatibacillaceae bacterium]